MNRYKYIALTLIASFPNFLNYMLNGGNLFVWVVIPAILFYGSVYFIFEKMNNDKY